MTSNNHTFAIWFRNTKHSLQCSFVFVLVSIDILQNIVFFRFVCLFLLFSMLSIYTEKHFSSNFHDSFRIFTVCCDILDQNATREREYNVA